MQIDQRGYPISAGQQIDTSKLQLKKLSDLMSPEKMSSYLEQHEKFINALHTSVEKTDSPRNQAFADIVVTGPNGKQQVIASIDNNGYLQTNNNFYQKYGISLEQIAAIKGQKGPELAAARAEKIAELTGGSVELKDTALDQQSYLSAAEGYINKINLDELFKDANFISLTKLKQAQNQYAATLTSNSTPDSNPI